MLYVLTCLSSSHSLAPAHQFKTPATGKCEARRKFETKEWWGQVRVASVARLEEAGVEAGTSEAIRGMNRAFDGKV